MRVERAWWYLSQPKAATCYLSSKSPLSISNHRQLYKSQDLAPKTEHPANNFYQSSYTLPSYPVIIPSSPAFPQLPWRPLTRWIFPWWSASSSCCWVGARTPACGGGPGGPWPPKNSTGWDVEWTLKLDDVRWTQFWLTRICWSFSFNQSLSPSFPIFPHLSPSFPIFPLKALGDFSLHLATGAWSVAAVALPCARCWPSWRTALRNPMAPMVDGRLYWSQ